MRKFTMSLPVASVAVMSLMFGCQAEGGSTAKATGGNPSPAAVNSSAAAMPGSEHAVPGFVTITSQKDGRLWVFPEGSKELAEFKEKGEPARQVLRPGAGPGGVTLKAYESEHIDAYLKARGGQAGTASQGGDPYARPGFFTTISKRDGRLWVIPEGSKELAEFKEKGEPARQVLRPAAGPGGITIKAYESEHIDAYLAAQ